MVIQYNADYTKHASTGPFNIPPKKVVQVDPEKKKGIRPFIAGPAILSCKVNLDKLPKVGAGRPFTVKIWARRWAEGDYNNATGQAFLAVPQNSDPEFRAVWTYTTFYSKKDVGDKITFYIEHDGETTLTAVLEQTSAIVFAPLK